MLIVAFVACYTIASLICFRFIFLAHDWNGFEVNLSYPENNESEILENKVNGSMNNNDV